MLQVHSISLDKDKKTYDIIVVGMPPGVPEYLRWLWLDGLQHNTGGVFYVPTESNVPIMEAGRAVNKNITVEVDEKK